MTSEVFPKGRAGKSAAEGARGRKIQPMDWVMMASLSVIIGIFVYTSIFTREFPVDVVGVVLQCPYQTYTRSSAAGIVVPKRRAGVVAQVAGQLVELAVEEGGLVEKGQVIARLEGADAAARKDQAEARHRLAIAKLEQARVDLAEEQFNLARYKKLLEMGTVSRSEYKSAEAGHLRSVSALDAAESLVKVEAAALKSAEIALDHTQIRVPFGGMILKFNADIGDMVVPPGTSGSADTSIATVADVSVLAVEVEVSESVAGKVRQGQSCVVDLDSLPDVHFTGEVDAAPFTGDRGQSRSLVKVRIIENDPRIRPDMAARVSFLSRPLSAGDDVPRVLVHSSAIVSVQDETAVYLVRDERAVLKKVRAGTRFHDRVEILGGISVGDRVIANPPKGIKNGSRLVF
jgi:RND family efflux transporter MFP subunit